MWIDEGGSRQIAPPIVAPPVIPSRETSTPNFRKNPEWNKPDPYRETSRARFPRGEKKNTISAHDIGIRRKKKKKNDPLPRG